jgi:leucyl-tRNA synthetase
MYGRELGSLGIRPEELSPAFWNYVFLDGPYEGITVPQEKLDIMRREFKYWYPLDLRCSGKDLIRNHLTFALLNHAAIFKGKKELWPRAYFCNGYILVDGNKMSK